MFNLALSKLHVAEENGVEASNSKALLKEALALFRQARNPLIATEIAFLFPDSSNPAEAPPSSSQPSPETLFSSAEAPSSQASRAHHTASHFMVVVCHYLAIVYVAES